MPFELKFETFRANVYRAQVQFTFVSDLILIAACEAGCIFFQFAEEDSETTKMKAARITMTTTHTLNQRDKFLKRPPNPNYLGEQQTWCST